MYPLDPLHHQGDPIIYKLDGVWQQGRVLRPHKKNKDWYVVKMEDMDEVRQCY
jgi:hypothetical protein